MLFVSCGTIAIALANHGIIAIAFASRGVIAIAFTSCGIIAIALANHSIHAIAFANHWVSLLLSATLTIFTIARMTHGFIAVAYCDLQDHHDCFLWIAASTQLLCKSLGHHCCSRQLLRSLQSLAQIVADKDGNSHGSDGRKVTMLGYDHSDLQSK